MANETDCKTMADDSSAIKAVKILAYSFILAVSLLGNSAIITITARNKRTRTTVNYLIANMAASDLLISTFAVPNKLCQILLGPRAWLIDGIVGAILCKLVYFFQDVSIAVSIQSLVVISIERYRAIVYPFRPAVITTKRCKLVIALIWFTSVSLHGIYFYAARLVSRNNTTTCDFSWEPKFDNRKTHEQYVTIILAFLVLLPFCVITFTYSRIIWSLKNKGVSMDLPSHILRRKQAENTKVFKNVCAIVVAFACCVLPIYIYGILFYFVWKWKMPCYMDQYGFVAYFALYLNAAISPVICLVCINSYRQGLRKVLKRLNYCQKEKRIILNQEDRELKNVRGSFSGDGQEEDRQSLRESTV